MPSFLKEFFPVVYERTQNQKGDNNNYCKYDNQGLQLFTSSLYVAALLATLIASYTTRVLGRRRTMIIAGMFFIVGTMLNATAVTLSMLILGRICLGCGVGFANQVRSCGKLSWNYLWKQTFEIHHSFFGFDRQCLCFCRR